MSVRPGPASPADGFVRPIGGSHTFGGRHGRMSPSRRRALDEIVPRFVADPPYPDRRVIVEIGCGRGDATAAMAAGDGDSLVIACEPNAAMIANLALLIDDLAITNIRLWVGDAFDLLERLAPASVAEIRVWFPDPWPKARHAGKRLIAPARLARITDALAIGGRLRLATDDEDYGRQAVAAIGGDGRLVGGTIPRPAERPITVFEARAVRDGRTSVDVEARRIV